MCVCYLSRCAEEVHAQQAAANVLRQPGGGWRRGVCGSSEEVGAIETGEKDFAVERKLMETNINNNGVKQFLNYLSPHKCCQIL